MKQKFENILERHGIFGEDVEEVLFAVSDMLEFMADKMATKEPYATESISKLENAAYEVADLVNFL